MKKLSELSKVELGEKYLADDGVVVEAVESEDYCTVCYLNEDDSCECPMIKIDKYPHMATLLCVWGCEDDKNCIFKKV